jgi:hypothetical protein
MYQIGLVNASVALCGSYLTLYKFGLMPSLIKTTNVSDLINDWLKLVQTFYNGDHIAALSEYEITQYKNTGIEIDQLIIKKRMAFNEISGEMMTIGVRLDKKAKQLVMDIDKKNRAIKDRNIKLYEELEVKLSKIIDIIKVAML